MAYQNILEQICRFENPPFAVELQNTTPSIPVIQNAR